MKAIITGMNGTVAPYVARELEAHGFTVISWDRSRYPTHDRAAGQRFLYEARPDWLLHIGMGPADWAEFLAREAAERGIQFLFTSTVSVYADRATGPITVETPADNRSDYALYKLDCEARIHAANPEAITARISWQIGTELGTNNMYAQLDAAYRRDGLIEASTRWYPACARLADTAVELHRLRAEAPGGIYLLDSNTRWNYYQIATAINRAAGAPWRIRAVDDIELDLRMVDPRCRMPPLEQRLPLTE